MASNSVSSFSNPHLQHRRFLLLGRGHHGGRPHLRVRAASVGDSKSYLEMWRKAVDRERRSVEFARRLEAPAAAPPPPPAEADVVNKTARFEEMLRMPPEERDRVQQLQVIDRAAAAIAAARTLLKDPTPPPPPAKTAAGVRSEDGSGWVPRVSDPVGAGASGSAGAVASEKVPVGGDSFPSQPGTSTLRTPGPDFWSWSPPSDSSNKLRGGDTGLKPAKQVESYSYQPNLLMEKEHSADILSLPLERSLFEDNEDRSLPPFQSFVELETVDSKTSLAAGAEEKLDTQFSKNAAEAARALSTSEEASSYGVYPDGSMWWKETGVEQRPDGVICKWTLTRGVSADGAVEWEDKYWEASDQFDHKELGSEKSGRDSSGNVWREYWKESMWQDFTCGDMHMEKTADKWGKNGKGDEWQEQWWEHYDATGKAEKWADKWCSIDPNIPLDAGHAHVWHERWGEKYDGIGGSVKYTDKWAERSEGDGWSKWGDKWDENFDPNGHGVKQGETWWEGKHGDRWNRTWGERHNGSGWVHKYGKSSSGEHWDTHAQQDTWYERYPHFGFEHCFNNSVQLRSVRRQTPN